MWTPTAEASGQSLACPWNVPTQRCLCLLSPVCCLSPPSALWSKVQDLCFIPPDTALHLCLFPSLTMSCGSSQKARLCITTYTNNPDPSGFPHAYPGDLMDFPQDSNPKERVSLLASDQSTLLSPLFKYFILSSVLTPHGISCFNVAFGYLHRYIREIL